MTGVPSRAARVVSENNDGLRSKTPFGTVGTAPGAWQGTSKVEQAVSLTPGRLSRNWPIQALFRQLRPSNPQTTPQKAVDCRYFY